MVYQILSEVFLVAKFDTVISLFRKYAIKDKVGALIHIGCCPILAVFSRSQKTE